MRTELSVSLRALRAPFAVRLLRASAAMVLTLFVATCHSDSGGPCVGTLVFTAQPSSLTAGVPFSVTVQVQDASGNVQSCFTDNVTLSVGSGPAGGSIAGTTTVAAVSGVASFTSLTITRSGGYTLAAAATGLTGGTSAGFTTTPAAATALSVTTQPTNTTAGATISTVVVTVLDGFGNTAGIAGNVMVGITPGTGAAGATLSGMASVSAASGTASFSTLSINRTGTRYTLTATATGLAPATSSVFNINPGATTNFVFTIQPSNGSAGSPISPDVVVSAQDAQSNPTPAFVGPVTIAIGANPGGGTLTGGGPINAVAGVATFPALSINKPGTGYTLTATSGAIVATSALFNVAIGPLAQLVFTQQPTNAPAGVAIAPAVVVTAQDAASNTVTGFTGNVDMAIGTNPASGTLSGDLTVAAVAGVATFSNLEIDKASPGYTLTATAGAVNQASATFSIIAGAATQLVFTVQPVNTAAGASVTPAIRVTAQDAFNNNATSFANAVTVAITGGTGKAGATLSGTLTKPAVSGVVSFDNLSIDSVGTGYTLSATAAGLVGAFASASFNITPNVATQLVFTTQPSNRTAGVAIAPAVVVTARDFKGNTATGFTGSVTVAIGNNAGPGGVLSGTLSMNANAGVATFATLSINKSGIGYTLTTSSTGLTGATSAAFNIIAGAATKVAFTVQPVNTAAAPAAITPAVEVSAQDALNNTDLTFTGNITVAIGTNAGTPTAGALGGTLIKAAVAGVASFNDLNIDKVGNGYTLTANATSLSGATSATFNIFANTATHLVFTVQPSNEVAGVFIAPAVVVSALDASNNVVPVFTGGITVTISNDPSTGPAAVLSGTTTVTATAGVATFSDLSIDNTGDGYTLDADGGGLTGVTSAAFNITPAAATHLVFSGQPSDEIAGAAIAPTVTVSALDAFDNVDTAYTTNIAVAIGTNPPPGTGILSGTTSAAAVNGVATFSDLSINRSGVGYTLLATSGLLTAANSAAFTITHAALNQLVFTVQPVNTGAGQTIAPDVTVAGQDQFGNTVTSFVGDVDIAIGNNAGPGGILSGTKTQTATTGTAAFNDLSIDKAGSGYTLSATTAGLVGAFASAPFDITAGAASVLTFTVQPGSTTAGTSIAAIIVAAQDALGNTVATFGDDIAVAIGTNGGTPTPGTLSGTTTIAASAGLATFSNLSINKSGPGYTLSATSPVIAGAFVSAPFAITAGAATTLAFILQPVTATAGPPATIPTVQVDAQDGLGNTDPTFTGDVTVSIGTNGGTPTPGSLSGTTTVANATAGVATFTDLSIDKKGTGYTLAASTTAGGVTGATSSAFDINAGAATTLVLTQQPTNAVAGASIVPAVTVEARDAHANVDPAFTSLVTLEFVNNAGSPVLGALSGATATASLGIATFPTLSVNKVGTGYTIRAAASGGAAASATSSAFNITPGLANNLAFTVQPSQTTVGANISPAVRVTVRDINDNTVTSFSGNVAVAITLPNAPGGALGGTLTKAAVAGVVTYSALDIDVAGSYQLTATSSGLTPATSVAFNIIASVATQLVFTVHPKTTTAGAAITGTLADVEVTARDASGQTASSFIGDITLSITPGTGSPGAVLIGTTTETATLGVATFPNILIQKSGSSYKLTASAVGGPPPTEATSGFFSITHDAAVQLEYQVQPSNATVNAAIAPPVEVKAVDQFGNTVTGFTDNVVVAITPGTGLGGTLSGTLTKAAVQGVATFNDLSIDVSSLGVFLYGLDATTPAAGVAGASSALFDITSSASNRLVVTAQPPSPTTAGAGFSVQITAQDAVGNPLIGFANDVTLSITAGTGTNGATLSGTTTVTPVDGVANFSGLSIDKSGFGYKLSATATNIAGATTATFTINAGAASQVDFIQDPTTTGAGLAIQPAVQVEVADALGNRVTNFVGDVTVAIFTNPSGGTLSGTATAAVSSGVASFNNLSIDAAGTGYRLQASSGALATDLSSAFSITAGAATQLIFTVAPSNQTAGIAISPAIRVTALDALGNVAPTFGGDVTVAITSGTGAPGATLSGVLLQTAVNGVATFPGLSIDKAAVDYTLSATTTTPAVTGTTSATFAISHAAATHVVFTVQPSNTAANAAIVPAVQVTARDQFENLVTAFVGNVTVTMGTNAGGPGSILSGTLIQPVTNGVATFDDLSINNVGVGYTITAQTGAFPLAGSAAFNISPPPPAAATHFAVLANAAVTCTDGNITGNVGTFLATPTGSITLTSCPVTGTLQVGDAAAKQSFNDFLNMYTALAPKLGDVCTTLTGTLAGVTLSPGVYCFDAAATLTGVLTLDGPADGIWTFKIGTSGTGALTGSNFSMVMAGGGQPANVTWWVAQGVDLTDSQVNGTILGGAGITLTRGTLDGNARAKADVTITGTTLIGDTSH